MRGGVMMSGDPKREPGQPEGEELPTAGCQHPLQQAKGGKLLRQHVHETDQRTDGPQPDACGVTGPNVIRAAHHDPECRHAPNGQHESAPETGLSQAERLPGQLPPVDPYCHNGEHGDCSQQTDGPPLSRLHGRAGESHLIGESGR